MEQDEIERKRQLDRERGRRYRERHRERVREMARKRVANYRNHHPDVVAGASKKHRLKMLDIYNSDPYAAIIGQVDRFWKKVEKTDGCWRWTGAQTGQGYGKFTVFSGKWLPASRVALILRLGRMLEDGKFACHTCDNPICCNPDHLYEGTQQENIRDKHERNRYVPRRGDKINEDIARKILEAEGTHEAIAKMFNVNRTMVSMIKSGKRWGRLSACST